MTWGCIFFGHNWTTVGRRRYCRRCGRKQVVFRGRWTEHTFPLDGDDHQDHTPIDDHWGQPSTVAKENAYWDMVHEAGREWEPGDDEGDDDEE